MSDHRDTNHDGKVSLMEKVKDKLHLGGHKDAHGVHTTTTTTHTGVLPVVGAVPVGTTGYDSRDLNRDGHVSASERLATGHTTGAGGYDLNRDGHISTSERLASGHHTTGLDSRDLNRDGHVSTSERLASGHHTTGLATGHHDSRDLNRDGHVSASERLATGSLHTGIHETDETRMRLHEEQLAISKRQVGAGEVDIHKRVQEEHVSQTVPVRREEVVVERRALHGAAEPGARIAAQDETVRVPLYREEIVTEKRIVPTEEVIVRKKELIGEQTVGATLRSEYVETSQTGAIMDTHRDAHLTSGEKRKGSHLDSRDTNHDGHVSVGEKLKSATR